MNGLLIGLIDKVFQFSSLQFEKSLKICYETIFYTQFSKAGYQKILKLISQQKNQEFLNIPIPNLNKVDDFLSETNKQTI